MSPRFTVRILAGRSLSAEFNARDADAAEAIARYLFEERRERSFRDHGEEIVDLRVDGPGQEGGQ